MGLWRGRPKAGVSRERTEALALAEAYQVVDDIRIRHPSGKSDRTKRHTRCRRPSKLCSTHESLCGGVQVVVWHTAGGVQVFQACAIPPSAEGRVDSAAGYDVVVGIASAAREPRIAASTHHSR
jgi:hypothetical protein